MDIMDTKTPTEASVQIYQGFARLAKRPRVWTPTKEYDAPALIAVEKTPVSMNMEQTAKYLRGQKPNQRILTFGESFQCMLLLEGTEDGKPIADGMATGPYERSATIAVYTGARKSDDGSFYHGLLVQIPFFDAQGNMVSDGNGVPKGRDMWEMALPSKSGFAKELPKECDPFLNTLYGMEEARAQLPANTFVNVWPEGGLNNFLRGRWSCDSREGRRVTVDGGWRPSHSREHVASRGAVDNARLVCKLNEAEYAASLDTLIQNAKQAPPEEAADFIRQINEHLKGALGWEDI